MVRKTRKLSKGKGKDKGMTVPQLRHAFERIEAVARSSKNVEAFRKEWKKTFGKEVSRKSAQEYLDFVVKKQTRRNSQKGGMAPLNYDLRAGADIPYGSYPPYVSSGFGFANQDSIAAVCGKEDITPVPPAGPSGLGSNIVRGGGGKTRKNKKQRGGAAGFFPQLSNNFSEFISRPASMSSPPTMAQDMQMLSKGYNGFPSPNPTLPTFNFSPNTPIYSSYLSPSSVRV